MIFLTLPHQDRPSWARLSLQASAKGPPYRHWVTGRTQLSLYAQDKPGVVWAQVYRQVLLSRGVPLERAAIIVHHPEEETVCPWHIILTEDSEMVNYWCQASPEATFTQTRTPSGWRP